MNLIDPNGLAGIAIEAGGGAGTGLSGTDSAGTGFYIGANRNGYAEIGAYTNQQRARMEGFGRAGVGYDFTAYFVPAENFFQGRTHYRSWTVGPATYTRFYDECENQIGVQVTIWGVGGGLGREEGVTNGQIYPLQ